MHGKMWPLSLALLASACGGGSDDVVPTGTGSEPPGSVVVATPQGPVEGWREDGVRSFLGIPYAAPPVGTRRWAPPGPVDPWTEPRNALAEGRACPQEVPVLGRVGDEDCLFVNVHTPDPAPVSAPVMVWIHGGGFTIGQGMQTDGGTAGDRLARASGHVVVSLNYRLGALGFLAHPELGAEQGGSSGNYGMMDQTAALAWVRDNIAAYGGNPDDVTIFGQSAGSMSVCHHLTAASSRGLFHKAIMESGSCALPMADLAAAEQQGQLFASALGCNDLACMRAASVEAIASALPPNPSFIGGGGAYGYWGPIVDGTWLTRPSGDVIADGEEAAVPVLGGFARDEGTLFVALAYDQAGTPVTAEQYPTVVADFVGPALAPQVLAAYPLADYATPGAALAEALGDAIFRCPGRALLGLLGQRGPVYAYQFEYPDAAFQLPLPVELGAYHAAEVQFVFGHPAALFVDDFAGAEAALSSQLMGYWARFAAQGDPNGGEALAWPSFEGDASLRIDVPSATSTGVGAGACAFWDALDYLKSPL